MLKERHRMFVTLLVLSDIAVLAAAQALTVFLGGGFRPFVESGSLRGALFEDIGGIPRWLAGIPFIAIIPVALVCMLIVGLYRPRRDRSLAEEFGEIMKATLITWVILVACVQFFLRGTFNSPNGARLILLFPFITASTLTLHRYLFRFALRKLRERGWNLRHVAIIGAGRLGQIACHTFTRNSWTGINCAYFISHRDTTRRTECLGRPVYGGIDDLERTLENHRVDGVMLALPQSRSYLMPSLMSRLERFPVEVRIIPDISPKYMPINLNVTELDGMPVLSMRQSPLNGYGGMLKRALDLILATVALVLFVFPMLVVAAFIRLETPGPVIFVQERVSLGGKPFRIYKFRTMKLNATDPPGSQGAAAWTQRNDPRITNVGAFLRKFSLDELPQLINVIRGDMSLVGPRPERVDLLQSFRQDWRGYMLRQNIKPGMTGWAQINGLRGDTSLRKRVQYDLYYIRNWSFGFDLRILFLTIFRGFRHPNAH